MAQEDNTKICYTSLPPTDCPYYYMKKDGTLKCVRDTNDCLNIKYNYLLEKECKNECMDYYKLEDIDRSLNLIKCFKTIEKCLEAKNSNNEVATY